MSRKTLAHIPSPLEARRANATLRRELLLSTAQMLVQPGQSPKRLVSEFGRIARRLSEAERPVERRSKRTATSEEVAGLAEVLGRWSTDSRYLDESGLPASLTLRSLTHLIRSVFPRRSIKKVIEALLRSRSIRKSGSLFMAADSFVSYVEEATYVNVYLLEAHRDLMSTIRHNVNTGKRSHRFLERTVSIDAIPLRKLARIHYLLKREFGPAFNRLDDLLRSYQVAAGSSEPTTTLTFRAHVAENPILTGALAPVRARQRKKRATAKGSAG
jgi:hypothetical protein